MPSMPTGNTYIDVCNSSTFFDLYVLGGTPGTVKTIWEDAGGTVQWQNMEYPYVREAGQITTYWRLEPAGAYLHRFDSSGTCISPTPTPTPSTSTCNVYDITVPSVGSDTEFEVEYCDGFQDVIRVTAGESMC